MSEAAKQYAQAANLHGHHRPTIAVRMEGAQLYEIRFQRFMDEPVRTLRRFQFLGRFEMRMRVRFTR